MKKAIILIAIALTIPITTMAKDMWYSTEEQQRIDQNMAQMQDQIDELKTLNAQLQTKVDSQPATVVQSAPIITDNPQTIQRVTNLESRVSTLEKVVDFIQTNVIALLTNIINLLKQLLK